MNVEVLTVEELRAKLESMDLPTTGTKAVLRERLRGALEPEEDPDVEDLTCEKIDAMKKAELQRRLEVLSLKATGNKKELQDRLKAALELNEKEEEDEDEEEDLSEEESNEEEEIARSTNRRSRGAPMLTYRDVEDALETFSGDDSQKFERWITQFEETAHLCSWTNVQKVIYAKRLLRGSAKLFANYECSAKSWTKFRNSLKEEFSAVTNTKMVHQQLSQIKKKADESYQEYIYRVLDIASHAEMELEAKIQYIIDGIQDYESNKMILYGAKTIKELRQKFVHYEAMVNRSKVKSDAGKQKLKNNNKTYISSQKSSDGQNKKCYNCGDKQHMGKDCPNKAKGTKCFSCGEFGHISTKCPSKDNKDTHLPNAKTRCDALYTSDKKLYKTLSVAGRRVEAMIDSGSDLHLVRSSFYIKLGAPPLKAEGIPFGSVGVNRGVTLGSFEADICVDGISLKLRIHIVPDDFISHDVLIGGELSNLVEVRLKKRQVECRRYEISDRESKDRSLDISKNENSTEVSVREILNINIEHEGPKYNQLTEHITNPKWQKIVEELVENYVPTGTADRRLPFI